LCRPNRVDDTGGNAFSRFLFAKLKEGCDVRKAFTYAMTTLVNMGYPVPQFDDSTSRALGGVLSVGV
jgi:hypothetical protein